MCGLGLVLRGSHSEVSSPALLPGEVGTMASSGNVFMKPQAKGLPLSILKSAAEDPCAGLDDYVEGPTFKELLQKRREERADSDASVVAPSVEKLGFLVCDGSSEREDVGSLGEDAGSLGEDAGSLGEDLKEFCVVSTGLTKSQKKRRSRKAAAAAANKTALKALKVALAVGSDSGLTMEERRAAILEAAQKRHREEDADNDDAASDTPSDHKASTSSSKLSSTRSWTQKGPSEKARREERMRLHLEKKGATWDPLLKGKVAAWQVEVSTGLQGEQAKAAQQEVLDARDKEKQAETAEQKEARLLAALREETSVPLRCLELDSTGELRCSLCQKMATAEHMNSGGHMLRLENYAIELAIGGLTSRAVLRRQQCTTGLVAPCSKKNVASFWGDALPGMPMYFMKKLGDCGALTIQGKGSKNKAQVQLNQLCKIRLSMVSYAGSGKYDGSCELNHFDDLPDGGADEDEESERGRAPPAGQGWWPVISFSTKREVVLPYSLQGLTFLCCFYQLMEQPLVAWPWYQMEE